MLAHFMKPIWKRKTRHLMLSLEILLAFVVVFAIAAFGGRYYQLSSLPIGFSYDSVWSVDVLSAERDSDKSDPEIFDKLKRSLAAMPEIETVSFASFSPYRMSQMQTEIFLPDSGASTLSDLLEVSDDFFTVTSMSIQEGRWFSSADAGALEQPVVMNRSAAAALFPGQSALGKLISDTEPGTDKRSLYKVVGIFEDYRSQGEYQAPRNFIFFRLDPNIEGAKNQPTTLLLKMKPGTDRSFESKLIEQLKLVRNDWGYTISPLSELRKSLLATQRIPLIVLSVIASFLLVMVAFGLFGVLWQSTTQRIPEIGLRRAIGANAGNIYTQIVVEQLLLSSLAMAVGLILLVQLPITGALGASLDWPLFLAAVAVAMAAIYLLSTVCALYPAWRASRLSPTEALHYE